LDEDHAEDGMKARDFSCTLKGPEFGSAPAREVAVSGITEKDCDDV
jgi:hypothetical protein